MKGGGGGVWLLVKIYDLCRLSVNLSYSAVPISRTSRGNANWFEKSGVWHQIWLNWPGIV